MDNTVATDEQIAQYVDALRDAYLILRRQTRPESFGFGRQHDPELKKLAVSLFNRRANPYSYMQYMFDRAAVHGNDVTFANIIFSPKMLNMYFMERPERESDLRILYGLMSNTLSVQLKKGKSLERVLLDPSYELNAVFRYVAALAANQPRLAEVFAEDAKRMMMFEPLYAELYKDWLPKPQELRNVEPCARAGTKLPA